MAIDVPLVAVPPPAPALPTIAESAEFDRRWAAWQAKNAAHDRMFRRKAAVALPILLAVVAVLIYTLFGR